MHELAYALLGAAVALLVVIAVLGRQESRKERQAMREHMLHELMQGKRESDGALAKMHEAARHPARHGPAPRDIAA